MQNISRTGPVAFKDFQVEATETRLGLPKKEIKAWQKARKKEGAIQVVGKATATVLIGWPKDSDPAEVPVLAAAEFEDSWEVLALYGVTHRLFKREIVGVEERHAA